jgi:adenylate cyclase
LRRELDDANAQLDFLLRHYIPPEVADALLEQRIVPQPGGEQRQVSVLFADLRGYTSIAEQLSPTQTMTLVNEYLSVACNAIAETEGTITQFMGDAVMAIFNAPDEQLDHAWRAVRAGLAIQERTMDMNAAQAVPSLSVEPLPILHFGVGIQTGLAVVGNTGAHWRYDYSAIGDTTNVAFRLCSTARAQEVLIGPDTYRQVRDCVQATPLMPIQLKGKSKPLAVFRVSALCREPGEKT